MAIARAVVRANTRPPPKQRDRIDSMLQRRPALLRQYSPLLRRYSRTQAMEDTMTVGRAAASHIAIDFDRFACNLKSKHDAAVSRRLAPELCILTPPTRGPLCDGCATRGLHSGIQVKPNIRPSLRSGLTAYAGLSPGSDALLPPSPCRWLMRGPGWAIRITARLDAQTPGVRTTRFCRTLTAPVVRAMRLAHGCPPCETNRADAVGVHHGSPHVRDDRDTPL
jgi:hypothetical protein